MKFLEHVFKAMLVIGMCVALSVSASAYIDASMLTYTLQIVTGIVIAAGAAIGILIVRIKKKMKDKLNIDMDDKKETEDKLVRYDVSTQTESESEDDVHEENANV